MTFSSCLSEDDQPLVLDASVVINLLATGQSIRVLEALRRPIFLPDVVVREIEDGERPDRRQIELLHALIQAQVAQVRGLAVDSLSTFTRLVGGSSAESLGDGEAATIALAVQEAGFAVIDEKKATRLCSARYPETGIASTVDVLSHAAVETALGRPILATAALAALKGARMQVREHQFDWIAGLIGPAGVSQCSSLVRLARVRAKSQPLRAAG
jgi:predicted nucleic acid-binding protein